MEKRSNINNKKWHAKCLFEHFHEIYRKASEDELKYPIVISNQIEIVYKKYIVFKNETFLHSYKVAREDNKIDLELRKALDFLCITYCLKILLCYTMATKHPLILSQTDEMTAFYREFISERQKLKRDVSKYSLRQNSSLFTNFINKLI